MKTPASLSSQPRRSPAVIAASLATLLLTGAAISACGLTSGIDDLFAASGGTGSSTSGGTGGESSSSSSGTGSTTSSSSSGGAGGATSSSSSGSSVGGSGAGGNLLPPEDCLDGTDNDGDDLTDCADPDCNAGFECVRPIPGGWEGYYRVHEAPFPEAQPAPCPPNTQPAMALFAGPADAQCSACACGGVTGAKCGAAPVTCWSGSNSCGGGDSNSWTDALADGDCHKPSNLLGFNNQLSCKLDGDSQVLAPGSCPPSGGELTSKALWNKQVDICGAAKAGTGCDNGNVCIPRGTNDPGESLCVKKDGMNGCPDGWKLTTIQAFTSAADSRACTDCACNDAKTSCSATAYTFYDFNNCGNSDETDVSSGACTDVSPLLDGLSWSAKASLPTPSGSCEPSGGAPTGSVQPDGAVTFCCK